MCAQGNKEVRGVFTARVRSNRKIGPRFYKLLIEFSGDGAEAFARCRPGQFGQFDLSRAALPPDDAIPADLADSAHRSVLLRRPFSFSDVTVKNNIAFVEILYCGVGPCSLRMTTLKPADSITVIGPLGTGFCIPQAKKTALLIVGGMGAGPLEHLAKVLTEEHPQMQVQAFAGANSAESLPFERRLDEVSQGVGFSLAEFARFGIESQVATDDGSVGYPGLVTNCFAEWLEQTQLETKDAVIFSCGPEAMLARMADLARRHNIDCQISMERRMACGIAICQSCVVECRGENGESLYKLCCKDGPVFDSKEVIFKL